LKGRTPGIPENNEIYRYPDISNETASETNDWMCEMKRGYYFLLLLLCLPGCMGAQLKPSADDLRNIRTIKVVAMEAPPLEVPPSPSGATLFGASASMVLIPEQSLQNGGRIGVMVAGILMLADLPEAMRKAAKTAVTIDSLLVNGDAWLPTVVLVQEAARQIAAAGRPDVAVRAGLQSLPGIQNRERTFFGENWQEPLRNWYDEDSSRSDYRPLRQQGIDAVVEVGLLNYALYQDTLIVQVCLKLVDPATGRVLGRGRATDYLKTMELATIFADNGRQFKEMFSTLGNRLLTKNLRDIGLLPE